MVQAGSRRVMAAVLVVSALVVAGPAAAQDSSALTREELGLTVRLGFTEDASSTSWTPLEVRIAPTRLFAGELAVLSQHPTTRLLETHEVEVAAGSEKVYRFLVPVLDHVQVRISEDGRDPLTVTERSEFRRRNAYLVGALGEVPRNAPAVEALATEQDGVWVAVDPAWLDRSPRALDPLGVLVVPLSDLVDLGATARRNLADAVAGGLELTVVADRPGPIDLASLGLPWPAATGAEATGTSISPTADESEPVGVLALAPGPDAWALRTADLYQGGGQEVLATALAAGRGRLNVVGVSPGEGPLGRDGRLWSHVAQPGAHLVDTTDPNTMGHRVIGIASQSLRTSGLSLPSLPWLTAFLVAFVLLVGPVNGYVLARLRRRELAWVTIPAITLVFAVGAYLAAAGSQPTVGLSAHARYWVDGLGTDITLAAVRAPTEGTHDVVLPGENWDVVAESFTAPAEIDRSGEDTEVRLVLEALQIGSVMGWRGVEAGPPLKIETATGPDGLEVTVTNVSTTPVSGATLRVGTIREGLGDLEPGAQAVAVLAPDRQLQVEEPYRDDFAGMRRPDGTTRQPDSLIALLQWGVMDGNPGVVWVTATVGGADGESAPRGDVAGTPPITDGEVAEDHGTLIAVGATPDLDPGTDVSPLVVQRSLVPEARFGEFHRPSPLAVEGPAEAVLRFRLPRAGHVEAITPTLERGMLEGHAVEPGPAPVPPDMPPRPCPPDADCSWDGQVFEMCFEDGSCEAEVMAEPVQPGVGRPFGVELEVFDHAEDDWVRLSEAKGGDGTLEPARFLSPLGEIFVRAAGELFPFDFSGRGVGARTGEVSA